MNFQQILDTVYIFSGIFSLALFFYFYYTNNKFKTLTNKIFNLVPLSFVFNLLASKVEDKKNVFDKHDALVVGGRLTDFVKNTINNDANVEFDDVADDLFNFLNAELERYRVAGVKGVPSISDEGLRNSIKVIFEQMKNVNNENRI